MGSTVPADLDCRAQLHPTGLRFDAGQRPAIRAAGEVVLVDAATQFARYQQGGPVRNGELQSQPFPPGIIRAGLHTSLEQTLAAEQLARYKAEAKARVEQRKRATII